MSITKTIIISAVEASILAPVRTSCGQADKFVLRAPYFIKNLRSGYVMVATGIRMNITTRFELSYYLKSNGYNLISTNYRLDGEIILFLENRASILPNITRGDALASFYVKRDSLVYWDAGSTQKMILEDDLDYTC